MYMYMLVLLILHGVLTESCNGCTTGTFSFNNECRKCPEKCSTCDSETRCNLCKIGYHGETCSLACPQHCHDNECEKTSGTCLSCMKGYYSMENETCIQCPESCITCMSYSYCFACKSGYRGDVCEIACSNCKEGTSCDKKTGNCLESCKDGLSGDLCDTKCDVKCKSCVRRNNNECTTCDLDKHGINCNKNCSSTCVKNECNDSDGVCTNGCLDGYWGPMCENLCSANCKNLVCMIQNGTCLEGCTEGYYERNCSKAHYNKQARHFGLVVGPVICGTITCIIVTICTCYMYFKRTHLLRRFKWLNAVAECLFLCYRRFHKGKHKDEEMEVVAEPLNTSSETTNAMKSLDKNETVSLLPVGKLRIENDGTSCNNPNDGFQSSNGENYNTNANKETNSPMLCNANEHQTVNKDVCFINVASYKKSSKYIVSYGSKISLYNESVWKKIWESSCEIVVMLSTSQELEEYNNNLTFGSDQYAITVRFSVGRDWANYTMRPVTVEQGAAKSIKETRVVLFEFFADIKDNVKSFIEFHKMVNGVVKELNGPTLVHCSAGVHRCVTYLAVDMLQKNAKTIRTTDISRCLQHLNKHALETTKEQIDYISKIVDQLLTSHI